MPLKEIIEAMPLKEIKKANCSLKYLGFIKLLCYSKSSLKIGLCRNAGQVIVASWENKPYKKGKDTYIPLSTTDRKF